MADIIGESCDIQWLDERGTARCWTHRITWHTTRKVRACPLAVDL